MPNAKRKLTPVPFTAVRFNDAFWAPRMETNRQVTLQHVYQKLEETGRIGAFDLNFERPVPSPIVLIFGDSDLAKWIEAASYALAAGPDPDLEAKLDSVVNKVVSAQQPDGYLNTHFIHTQPEMRWKNLRDWHEMYCAGHLMEGAVAHHQITGSNKLLDALCRYADHIDATFGREPGKKRGYPGHPEIELALVRMYHETGNRSYLELASYFVEERGQQPPHYYDVEASERGENPEKFWARTYEYNQSHKPVREQEKVVGHAVRAMYLFSAAADLADEKDDPSLLEACDRLWDNLIHKRMYITGGIGPSRHNEGFTLDYDLPDETAYAETCATIGLVMWNHRLLQFEGERRFTDVLERGLYNGFLSGISLEGSHFFYENPLSSPGGHHRVEWFDCPCCPPNVARVIASIGNYFYSTSQDGLWVHLFASGEAEMTAGESPVKITQETAYPYSGEVKLTVDPGTERAFAVYLRLPGWCENHSLSVNGQPVDAQLTPGGYLKIERSWKPGDQLQYSMEMPVRLVFANPAVRLLEGRAAIQRGPLVYCLEGVDNENIQLDRLSVDPSRVSEFTVQPHPDLPHGALAITGPAFRIKESGWENTLYRSQPPQEEEVTFTAVPYYLWDNRTPGEMRVWLRAR